MLGILFENLSEIRKDEATASSVKHFLINVCGLTLESVDEQVEMTPEIRELIEKREQARKEKNWAEADRLREKLKEMGCEVQDKKL